MKPRTLNLTVYILRTGILKSSTLPTIQIMQRICTDTRTLIHLKSPETWLLAQANNKKSNKNPHYWPLDDRTSNAESVSMSWRKGWWCCVHMRPEQLYLQATLKSVMIFSNLFFAGFFFHCPLVMSYIDDVGQLLLSSGHSYDGIIIKRLKDTSKDKKILTWHPDLSGTKIKNWTRFHWLWESIPDSRYFAS